MGHNYRINEAIADLECQEVPNFTATALKYYLNRTTLSRRYNEKTRSKADFLSQSCQNLTNEQKEVLINYINRMTDRGMPPTTDIVRNLAEKIVGKKVGKN